MFKKFELTDVFNVERANCIPSKKNLIDGNIPYVTMSAVNNGRTLTCGNIEKINKGNCISVGGVGGAVFYQPVDWVAGNNMCRLWRDGLEMEHYLYIVGVMSKITNTYSYSNARTQEKIKKETLYLPVIENSNPDHEYTVDDIDWQYMRDRITELERDRITELERELDAYLQATGLNDYELTDDDKKILSLSAKRASDEEGTLEDNSEDEVRFGKFALGGDDGLFNIYSPKKRFNANTITFGGKYPYVARGSSNNGIRGYITEDEKYLSPAKSLSFGQDTATVYYQPDAYFTGDKIKVMVLNNRELTPELAEYFIAAIARAFSTFAWGQSSFNENIIKSMKIELPIKSDGTPDFYYMERYIRAMEKVVIADVVKYKDKVIETTKKVVGEY